MPTDAVPTDGAMRASDEAESAPLQGRVFS
jgi:hypothetical protein